MSIPTHLSDCTRVWIDCEWNGEGGELMSIALVAEDGRELYAIIRSGPDFKATQWIWSNVVANLYRFAPIEDPDGFLGLIALESLPQHLADWLAPYQEGGVHLVADWPEDIARFCLALITGPGQRVDTPLLTMEVNRQLHCDASVVPHNALSDARAIKAVHLDLERGA